MNYYKRHWDETTGEALTDAWGTSTWYFETDHEHTVLRQLQVFQNGKVLRYNAESESFLSFPGIGSFVWFGSRHVV